MVKLLEYEAKKILQSAGVPIPNYYLASNQPEFLPAVLKSQVPTGGRGKAGGIIIVKSLDEYSTSRRKLLGLSIKGHIPKTLLAEELLSIEKEFYLSLIIDKSTARIVLMAHKNGGVEVEENAAEDFLRLTLEHNNTETAGQRLADYYDLPNQTFFLQDLVKKLHTLFIDQDMTLLEINPFVATSDSQLVAGDAKIVLDDAAAFRHPDWKFETNRQEANFVTLNKNGNVATIANGAGLAMATVDAATDIGMIPANFLDIGGGASEASVLAAFNRIMEYPNIKVIVINIFAGITRCDEVARAIISAKKQISSLPPLAVRLAGTNYERAAQLLSVEGIPIHDNLESALKAAKEST
jgi:succinyl-CoA synthetase beta subunit